MRIVIIIIAVCMILTQAIGQDRFVITKTAPVQIASVIDWKAIEAAKPEPRKTVTYGYATCRPCKQMHADKFYGADDELITEYRDIAEHPLPSHYQGLGFPLTVLEDTATPSKPGNYIVGYITRDQLKDRLKRNPPSGAQNFFGPVSVGKISRRDIGLSQTSTAATVSLGGFSIKFPAASPEVVFNPPFEVGNGTIEITVTKVRLTADRLILTAKGWPVEFSLELLP